MSVIFAGVLWAVAAPVVIHLLMRTRPRTVTLPTMHFVRKTHRATVSRQKLKHLLLLALRMLAVLLIVLIVARALLPGFFEPSAGSAGEQPVAMVVIIDNSASMGYRLQGRSLLDRGKDQAAAVIARLPAGSRAAVLTTDGRGGYGSFMQELGFAAEQIRDVPPGYDGAGVAASLQRATAMLNREDLPRRDVLIITDNTAQAWRDIPVRGGPDGPTRLDQSVASDSRGTAGAAPRTDSDVLDDGIAVTVIDVGVEQDANISLGAVDVSATSVPLGTAVRLRTSLGGSHVGGEQVIDVELGGEQRQRLTESVVAGQRRTVTTRIAPRQEGTRHGRIVLHAADPLEADNVRYVTVEVGPPATVLVVSSPAVDDATAGIMAAAVAPSLPAEQGGFQRRRVAAESLSEAELDGASLVLLANTAALRDEQWRALERFVRGGGVLWFVPGSVTDADACNTPQAQRVLPATLGQRQTLEPTRRVAAADATHPMLAGFADPANPPLTDVQVRQRLTLLDPAADAETVLADSAGEPLILTRPLGAGQVVLWATSPVAEWSNLAQLGGQLVVLTRSTVEAVLGEQAAAKQADWGSVVELPLPAGVDGPMVSVSAAGEQAPRVLEADLRRGAVSIEADRLGGYTARFTRGRETLTRGFSVNVPAAESDLRRVDTERLRDILGPQSTIVTSADQWSSRRGQASQPLDLLPLLFIALMAVLVGESFFANRFYKRAGNNEYPTRNDEG